VTLYDHILGGLYGQALGDAWCMPAMLTPDQTWQRYSGWIDRFYPGAIDHPVHGGLPAARITDDTEQAFQLATVIIEDQAMTEDGAVLCCVGTTQLAEKVARTLVPVLGVLCINCSLVWVQEKLEYMETQTARP